MKPLTQRERAYVEVCARDMHPDLYAGKPESKEAKALRERFALADQLADLRDLYLTEDVRVHKYTSLSPYFTCTVHDYTLPPETGYIDAEASLAELRRMTQVLRRKGCKIGKEHDDRSMRVYGTYPSGLKIVLTVDRSAVCTKKVVGQKWIEPSQGRYEDVVEWDCAPVSILKSGEV